MSINSNISGFSTKFTSTISKVARSARSRTVLAAAVAATSLASGRFSVGAISDITGLATKLTTGSSTTVSNVTGYGASYSPFLSTNTYTMHYLGEDQAITSVTAGALGTYNVSSMGTAVFRRAATGSNNDTVWYLGSGTGANHSTITLDAPIVSGYNQAFNTNNLMIGADNIFSNKGNAVGDNTNVDRVDLIFSGGIKAATSSAFSIFDRGASGDHDAFEIAAITSLSGGAPSGYGPLLTFHDGTWGIPALVTATTQEDITRENNAVAGDTLHPSDSTAQSIGGVLIQTSSLVPSGTTIYGYSLFAPTINGSGGALVDWTNQSVFLPADSTSTGGGLDPSATIDALYTSVAVPEPATGGLAALVIGGFIARRPKRLKSAISDSGETLTRSTN